MAADVSAAAAAALTEAPAGDASPPADAADDAPSPADSADDSANDRSAAGAPSPAAAAGNAYLSALTRTHIHAILLCAATRRQHAHALTCVQTVC